LPPLNGFIGEFLILIGTFQNHHAWAAWAASGAVLSAIYLLWAYQRVGFGEVTVEKNRSLPDASGRERLILATMAVAIIFMGVASPLFTRRMQSSTNNLLNQMERVHNVSRPAMHDPAATQTAVASPSQKHLPATAISLRRVQP
jgi:NADH-quinone oxidoreductase subunit M